VFPGALVAERRLQPSPGAAGSRRSCPEAGGACPQETRVALGGPRLPSPWHEQAIHHASTKGGRFETTQAAHPVSRARMLNMLPIRLVRCPRPIERLQSSKSPGSWENPEPRAERRVLERARPTRALGDEVRGSLHATAHELAGSGAPDFGLLRTACGAAPYQRSPCSGQRKRLA
jgi:hypothetical protein